MPLSRDNLSEEVMALGEKAMGYLIDNPEQLSHFMNYAGVTPDMMRQNFGSREMALGSIDYFAQNESALLALCANANIDTTHFMRIWQRLNAQQ